MSNIKLPYDQKTTFDRIGDIILTRIIKFMAIVILSLIIVILAYNICQKYQDYLKSYHLTVEQVRAPFNKIEHVPSWHITFTYND